MIITEIKKQTKNNNRFNIYLDGQYYCGLNAETIVKNNLKTGMDIEKETLDNLQLESEKTTALEKLVNYMGSRLRTEKQLWDYLKGKGYAEATCNYCMEKLKEYNYINDAQYVNSFIQVNKNKKGKKLLAYELKQKGIDDKLLDTSFEDYENDLESIKLIALKYLKNKDLSKENFQKAYRHLMSKGFESSEVLKILNQIFKEDICE